MAEVSNGTGIFSTIIGEIAGLFGWHKAVKDSLKKGATETTGEGVKKGIFTSIDKAIESRLPQALVGKYGIGKKLLGPIGIVLFEAPDLYHAAQNGDLTRQVGRTGIKVGLGSALAYGLGTAGLALGPLGSLAGYMIGYAVGDFIGDRLLGKSIQEINEEKAEQGQVGGIKAPYMGNSFAAIDGGTTSMEGLPQVTMNGTSMSSEFANIVSDPKLASIFNDPRYPYILSQMNTGTQAGLGSGMYTGEYTGMQAGAIPSSWLTWGASSRTSNPIYYSTSPMASY